MLANLPENLRKDADRIMATNDAKLLLKELAKNLRISLDSIVRTALYIRRLEELGVTEFEINIPGLSYIRKIAYGQLLPELFLAALGRQRLLDRTSSLPMPDQRLVANNKPFKVMLDGGDHTMIPPLSMSSAVVSQVFHKGAVRDETEQVLYRREREERKLIEIDGDDRKHIKIDRRRGGIVVDGRFVSKAELVKLLADL